MERARNNKKQVAMKVKQRIFELDEAQLSA